MGTPASVVQNTPVVASPNPPFWKTPEGQKDIVTLAGVATDLVNLYGHFLPQGVATAIGLGLRAVINLFSGGNPQ